MKIGSKVIKYNDNFRLYVRTDHNSPTFSPELGLKTNIIDFAITPYALEDQLLTLVVQHERSDIESKRNALLENIINCEKVCPKSKKKTKIQ